MSVQQDVTVIGPITPGNAAAFHSTTVLADSGVPIQSVTLVNQPLIDASPDGTIITVAAGATISAINITNKALHFILLPGAAISVTGTITMESNIGTSWTGFSPGPGFGTQLRWAGNAVDPMFRLSRCQYCVFEFIGVNSSPGTPLATAFMTMSTLTGLPPTQCRWKNIYINGTNLNGLDYGFRIAVAGDVNGNNNDFHEFHQCTVANYKHAAWKIEQPEAKSQIFRNCVASPAAGTTSSNGIDAYSGGSFWVDGWGGGGSTDAEFGLGSPDDIIAISNFDIEASNRLLNTGASASPWPVRLSGGRFSTDGLNADGKVVIYAQRGPLIIENCQVDNVNNLNVQFSLEASGRCQGIAIGCNISSNLTFPFTTTNPANGRWVMASGSNLGIGTGGVISPAVPLPGIMPVLTVSELPPATDVPRGTYSLVTDATSTTVGTAVAGGGTNTVLVLCMGDNTYRIIASIATATSIRTQRSVTSSPIVLVAGDEIINVNISSGSPTCALPAASTRSGDPLTFKDVGGNFVAHNLTITPNGAETIDGAATLVLSTDFQSMTLYPFNDGVNTGWFLT